MEYRDDLLSLAEVSGILNVSKNTILRWIDKGKIRGVRVSDRLIKIPRNSLDEIIKPYEGEKTVTKKTLKYEDDPFLHVEEWAPETIQVAPEDLSQEHDHYLYGTPRKKKYI
jgi:excisionase family DNA binding protein